MNKLPLIKINEINAHIIGSDNFRDVFSITDLDGAVSDRQFEDGECTEPVRLNAVLMLLVSDGGCTLCLDYVPHVLRAHSFAVIMPSHIVQVSKIDSSFRAKLLVIDGSFLEEINTAKRSPSVCHYMLLRKNPVTEFQPEEAAHLETALELLQEKIRLRTHSFHKEVLQNAFVAFVLELANIMVGKKEDLVRPTLSRKEEILNSFLQLLLEHVKEQHIVTFYAEKLFITPQYLSLILKELTDKSANRWIDDVLIAEAKLLLKAPRATVQQVADSLHFSDQSTFGKFFKRHMGISPMKYRNQSSQSSE
jgi:AraC-like DNA-binding protein